MLQCVLDVCVCVEVCEGVETIINYTMYSELHLQIKYICCHNFLSFIGLKESLNEIVFNL